MFARAAWLLPFVLACSQAKTAAPTASASAPGGAPPPPAFAPDETWIHRTVELGAARPDASLVVATLARDRTHATLVIEKRVAHGATKDAATLAWETEEQHRYAGPITSDTGARFEAHLVDTASNAEHLLVCTHARRAVAPAAALRVRDPSFHAECGNRGVWQPAATVQVDVLACGSESAPDDFARSPGLETVGISEDCFMQGRGDRLIPDDSTFAPTGAFTR